MAQITQLYYLHYHYGLLTGLSAFHVASPYFSNFSNSTFTAIQISESHSYFKCSSGYQSPKTRRELTTKFRRKLKNIGKTTRPFRYDLNQIPYDYTVKVTNRFKGLDLIDREPEELWMEVCNILMEAVTRIIPKKEI